MNKDFLKDFAELSQKYPKEVKELFPNRSRYWLAGPNHKIDIARLYLNPFNEYRLLSNDNRDLTGCRTLLTYEEALVQPFANEGWRLPKKDELMYLERYYFKNQLYANNGSSVRLPLEGFKFIGEPDIFAADQLGCYWTGDRSLYTATTVEISPTRWHAGLEFTLLKQCSVLLIKNL